MFVCDCDGVSHSHMGLRKVRGHANVSLPGASSLFRRKIVSLVS